MRTGLPAALLLIGVLALTGCAGRHVPGAADTPGPDASARVEGVPFYAQTSGHCGPAALAMVLAWSGVPATPSELAPTVFTPARGGSLAHDVAAAARARGRLAIPVAGLDGVLSEVAAGHPVLVLQNLGLGWWPQWHYAVLTGYDLAAGQVRVHSGAEQDRMVGLGVFRRTFERGGGHGILVLPPDRLPATGDQAHVLEAAAGLERAGQPVAAAAAFAASLRRWPESAGAAVGLANANLALGRLSTAAQVLELAATRHPDSAAVWNNLAHVRLLQHELDSAQAAATRARDLGGAAARVARLTLEEIRAAREGAARDA